MKKLILTNILPILLIMTFVLSGCDGEGVMCAHLCDKTQGLSTNYAFNMVLDKDSRVEGKYVDLQIKCSDAGQIISFPAEQTFPNKSGSLTASLSAEPLRAKSSRRGFPPTYDF